MVWWADKTGPSLFFSLHLNHFVLWIVILLISAWVLNSRCSFRVLFSLQGVINSSLWVESLPLCCFFLLACADEVSRGGGTHTSWVSFGWLLSGGSGFSLDGLDRTVDLILHWWVGVPSLYIKCTPHLPWPLPSWLNWKSGFLVPGISHPVLSWPAGLIESCPTSLPSSNSVGMLSDFTADWNSYLEDIANYMHDHNDAEATPFYANCLHLYLWTAWCIHSRFEQH